MSRSSDSGSMKFGVTTEVVEKEGVISLSGFLSTSAEDAILKAYEDIDTRDISKLRFRFEDGFNITSAAIAVMITITSDARKKRRSVVAEGLTPHYKKVFELIGLTEYVKILD